MARINLLPWREERRLQQRNEFLAMLGAGAAAAVLVMMLISWQMSNVLEAQQMRNQYLQKATKKLDEKIKEIKELEETREKLLTRKQIIEDLQASRSQMVHLFDALVRTIPDGIRLNSIKQAGSVLTLEGKAQSNARVSAYLRALESNEWFTTPDLQIIESLPDVGAGVESSYKHRFILRAHLNNPNVSEEQAEVEL